jgi:hypothetical protein
VKKEIIFKYRTYNATSLELLVNRELWFAQPDSFNDPFDCSMDYEIFLVKAIKLLSLEDFDKEYILNYLRKIIADVRVCCFCETKKNQLMWSHYADEHKGFCIGFDKKQLVDNQTSEFASQVDYVSREPYAGIIEGFELLNDYNREIKDKDIVREILRRTLTTKYTGWKYEKEYRLISTKQSVLRFEPKSINSITFGLRMNIEHKKVLRKLLASQEWSHIKWFDTSKTKNKYALSFIGV